MSKTSLVLTVLGTDHPGIVDTIAQAVADQGGNWVESRMARLAGQFAGILRVEIDAEHERLVLYRTALVGAAVVGLVVLREWALRSFGG